MGSLLSENHVGRLIRFLTPFLSAATHGGIYGAVKSGEWIQTEAQSQGMGAW